MVVAFEFGEKSEGCGRGWRLPKERDELGNRLIHVLRHAVHRDMGGILDDEPLLRPFGKRVGLVAIHLGVDLAAGDQKQWFDQQTGDQRERLEAGHGPEAALGFANPTRAGYFLSSRSRQAGEDARNLYRFVDK
ncbi:hypothetical protein [Xanthomonas tesorieronis]|uniref:hypothetical protein n=1 Tax=Xanthomonas tesorieronis TaxID=3160839 RepID=UPI0035117CB5